MTMINVGDVVDVPVTKVTGKSVKVHPGRMSAETLALIFTHGLKQLVNDATSALKDADKVLEAATAMAKRLDDNAWSPGKGGGAALSPFDRQLRLVAEGALRQAGYKDADKTITQIASDPTDACRRVVAVTLAKMNGNDVSKVASDKLAAAQKKVMESWVTKARAALEAQKGLDVDLSAFA